MSVNVQVSEPPLGPAMAISLVVGTMIGGGIFVLPASLAPLGWNAAVGWVISGAGAMCLAVTLRFLMRDSGEGFHAVVERTLGPSVAFLAMWSFWTAGLVSIAALSVAAGAIASDLMFEQPPPGASVIASLAFLAIITGVNLAGTKSAGRAQVLTVVIKLVPLALAVVLITAFTLRGEQTKPLAPVPITFADTSKAVAMTLFALLGFEMVAVPAQKIRNPGRNIPVALIGGTGIVVAIYITVSTGLVLMMPWQEIAASSAPVSDLLASELGELWGKATAVCVLVAMVGCVNGLLFCQGDCAQSMAERGELPAAFARINARGVAHWGIISSFAGAAALILFSAARGSSGAFEFLILVTSGNCLVFYAVGVVAAARTNAVAWRWPTILGGLAFTALATYGVGLDSALWVWPLLALGLVLRWANQRSRFPRAHSVR